MLLDYIKTFTGHLSIRWNLDIRPHVCQDFQDVSPLSFAETQDVVQEYLIKL